MPSDETGEGWIDDPLLREKLHDPLLRTKLEDPVFRRTLLREVLEASIDKTIEMLEPRKGVRSTLVTIEGFLRDGRITPGMTERWVKVYAAAKEIRANKEMTDRARRRAKLVLERMDRIAAAAATPEKADASR